MPSGASGCNENLYVLFRCDLSHEDHPHVLRVAAQMLFSPETHSDRQMAAIGKQVRKHVVRRRPPLKELPSFPKLALVCEQLPVGRRGGQTRQGGRRVIERVQPGKVAPHALLELWGVRHVVITGQPLASSPGVYTAQAPVLLAQL